MLLMAFYIPEPVFKYSFELDMGAFLSRVSAPMFSTNMGLSTDLLFPGAFDNNVYLSYSLEYDGPGVKESPEAGFQDRYQNHEVSVAYSTPVTTFDLALGPSFAVEYYRAGRNEAWTTGIYNYYRFGVESFLKGYKWKASLSSYYFYYPNELDLTEAMATLGSSGISTEKAVASRNNFSLLASFQKAFEDFVVTPSFYFVVYPWQPVIGEDGRYSSTPQIDFSLGSSGYLLREDEFKTRSMLVSASGSFYFSNQAYFRAPATEMFLNETVYYPDFFSYLDLSFSFSMSFTSRGYLAIGVPVDFQVYPFRPPLNEDGTFNDDSRFVSLTLVPYAKLGIASREFSKWFLYGSMYLNLTNSPGESAAGYNFWGVFIGVGMEYGN